MALPTLPGYYPPPPGFEAHIRKKMEDSLKKSANHPILNVPRSKPLTTEYWPPLSQLTDINSYQDPPKCDKLYEFRSERNKRKKAMMEFREKVKKNPELLYQPIRFPRAPTMKSTYQASYTDPTEFYDTYREYNFTKEVAADNVETGRRYPPIREPLLNCYEPSYNDPDGYGNSASEYKSPNPEAARDHYETSSIFDSPKHQSQCPLKEPGRFIAEPSGIDHHGYQDDRYVSTPVMKPGPGFEPLRPGSARYANSPLTNPGLSYESPVPSSANPLLSKPVPSNDHQVSSYLSPLAMKSTANYESPVSNPPFMKQYPTYNPQMFSYASPPATRLTQGYNLEVPNPSPYVDGACSTRDFRGGVSNGGYRMTNFHQR